MTLQARVESALEPIQGSLHRVVESQEQIATTRIVDTLDEQAVLENMLEQSKPALPSSTKSLSYLLATPFRYPPLAHGSRFGRTTEPSLFYGSQEVETALAETAYYRCLFFSDMVRPPASGLTTQHLVFRASYRTDRGVRLQSPAWADLHADLTDPASYAVTQPLGSTLRDCEVGAFQFLSARALQLGLYQLPYEDNRVGAGINVALITPGAFVSTQPRDPRRLIVTTRADEIQMRIEDASGQGRHFTYPCALFQPNGTLLHPA